MVRNDRWVKVLVLSLGLIAGLTIVYIYWNEQRNVSGIFLGIFIAFVAPFIGQLAGPQIAGWLESSKNRAKNRS